MTSEGNLPALVPGLTVIVPIFNVEAYVEKSIKSILLSNVDNLHIIAVDDCGDDGSMDIVRRLAATDSRIEIISNNRNQGLAFSRNQGINHVSTSHLAFLDSDDWVAPDFYSRLMSVAIQEDSDIVAGNVIYVWPENQTQKRGWVSEWTFCEVTNDKPVLSTPKEKIGIICACACWNKVYSTEFIRKNSLYFPLNIYIEDVPFTFLSTALANHISLVKDTNLFYRQRTASIMNDLKSSKRIFDIFKVMDLCAASLESIYENERDIFRQILDVFIVINLTSWTSAVCANDYDRFVTEVRRRFRLVDAEQNPFLPSKYRCLWRRMLDIHVRWRMELFGCIPLGIITEPSWLTN